MSRRKNSIKNIATSFISNIVTVAAGVVAQAVFIRLLGKDFLGLNGLFSNIITMLSVAELGIGLAIVHELYKPIASNNEKKIKELMSFYKKCYKIIGTTIGVIGLCLIPLLSTIVDIESAPASINIYSVYLLFLLESVISYFVSYKRSILYASQKNHIIDIVHILYTILMNAVQILILYTTHDYYLYLITRIVFKFVENIVITTLANKYYPSIRKLRRQSVDPTVKKGILAQMRALFLHRIAGIVVNGTDNVLISKFFGLGTVGLYSNYYLIINAIQTIFSQTSRAVTASVGNLLVTETKEKQFDSFRKIRFLNFWIATFASIATMIIIEPFVSVWIGTDYIMDKLVLITLIINLYQTLMRNAYMSFKEAAGIFRQDKFVPLVEATTNIVFSILFIYLFGLAGVFMGTIASSLVIWFYSYPKYVYKNLFSRTYRSYARETVAYAILFALIATATFALSSLIPSGNIWLELILNILLAIAVPNILLLIIFGRTELFKNSLKLFKK